MNNIIAHFIQTGEDPHADRIKNQRFGFASSQSFEEAMRNTAEVQSAFQNLPSAERAGFDNNPALWLQSLEPAPTSDITPSEIVPEGASQAAESAVESPNPDEMDST